MTIATVEPGPYGMGGAGPYGAYATQPWTHVQWPASGWDAAGALALPSVSRAVQLIAGQVRQMPMDDYRDADPLARPRLLDAPDPNQARGWFVGQQVSDYLLHGNGLSYVTALDAQGYPAATSWLPASQCTVGWNPGDPTYRADYWLRGQRLDPARVVHVKRGADDRYPVRGVGVVEQNAAALARIANADRYESETLSGSGVPSVAVITPNPRLSPEEAALAKESWMERFGGPVREPAILPAGTQVIPLAWSPTDAQLNETRRLGLQDVANLFNLDGYFLGAEGSSMTYKSPGPMFLQLLRVTLEPILSDFEGVWSAAWLPRGRRVRFDRKTLLQDDLTHTIATLAAAVTAGLFTWAEARQYLGLPTDTTQPGPTITSPVATQEVSHP